MKQCEYSGLHYICPGNGGWGMVRIAMMIPESYELFISPAACGRHGSLGAIRHGIKDRLSYYFVDEKDIIAGYDQMIVRAAGQLLERLAGHGIHPRAVILFVTCMDDLIGTDHEAVAEELEVLHPDTYFLFAHMNPITDNRPSPPMVSIHKSVFGLLGRLYQEKQDCGLNCIGNLEGIRPECEFFPLAEMLGFKKVRHIGSCQNFEQFEEMAGSVCNAVLNVTAEAAAQQLERTCHQTVVRMYYSYLPEKIREGYLRLAKAAEQRLGKKIPEEFYRMLDEREAHLKDIAVRVREQLGGRPIALDDFACTAPFELAEFLLSQGFQVKYIGYREAGDAGRVEHLIERYPQVQILCLMEDTIPVIREMESGHSPDQGNKVFDADAGSTAEGNVSVCRPDESSLAGVPEDLICIGVDIAYVLKATYVENLFSDQGNYGYYGLEKMLEGLLNAAARKADLKKMIEDHGLVV